MKKSSNKGNASGSPAESAVGDFFHGAGTGLHRLNSVSRIIFFLISLAICAAAILFFRQFWALEVIFGKPAHPVLKILLLGIAFLLPLIYLNIIGGTGEDEPAAVFEEIGFLNKNGTPPQLAYTRQEKCGQHSITILGYASFLPLEKWKASRAELETALNCTIRSISQGRDKRTVELRTVPSDLYTPDNIAWDDKFLPTQDGQIVVGVDQLQQVSFNLNRTPHVLVAGETGSGKSVILRTILWQAVNAGCRIYMIDFKGGVEFGSRFEQYGEVITERDRALAVFQLLVAENTERLTLFRQMEVKNLPEYNHKHHENLCRIVVFVDEIAEMLDKTGVDGEEKELIGQLEGCLSSLARLSRATGINLILGVQRPDAKILTGQIKNNVPVRICGRFADRAPSEIVLGNSMAMNLPDTKGRFLYRMGNEMTEFQAYYFDDDKNLRDMDVVTGEMLIDGTRAAQIPDAEEEKASAAPEASEDAENPRKKKRGATHRMKVVEKESDELDNAIDDMEYNFEMIEEDI